MAGQAVEIFKAFMEAKGFPVSTLEEDDNVVLIGMKTKNTQIQIFVEFEQDDEHVYFFGRGFVNVPEEKQDMIYKLCNQCNEKFRFVKFVWNEDAKEVGAECDAIIQLDSCGEEIYEVIGHLLAIVDDAYPIFMKGLWA